MIADGATRLSRDTRVTRVLDATQLIDDVRHDLAGTGLDRDRDRMLVGPRLLQRVELTREQARWHEMLVPGRDAARDKLHVALEIDEAHVRPLADQDRAVAALQRRAGDDAVAPGAPRPVDPLRDGAEPRPAVLIRHADPAVHLFAVPCPLNPAPPLH